MHKIYYFLYSFFLISFSFFSYIFVDSNLIYFNSIYTGLDTASREITSIFYFLFILLYFVFYISFLILVKKNKINLKNFKILISLTVGFLILSYPAMLSYDVFNYIATAKVTFFYNENPYIIMPIEFTGDPILLFMHAANKTALYGLSWVVLTAIPYLLGLGNFMLTLFTFKLFILCFYLATIMLIWRISKNIFSAALFALNPLVIIETLVSSHNDIVMMFFALLSFYFIKTMKKGIVFKNLFLSIILLIISIFIKYATLILIPVFLYLLWKNYLREKINWDKIFIISAILMFLAFISAPIREEIYPWYAIWFLIFSVLSSNRYVKTISIVFSFSLLFRYVPFMLTGTHFDITPILKTIITFIPIVLTIFLFIIKNLWPKNFFRF